MQKRNADRTIPTPDVIVVGAGAGGIFAALSAAEQGAKVLLLEKTQRIGTKILISGGGKCNVAHDGPIESVLSAFRPNEARFLRPSVYQLPNHKIIELFTSGGLRVYTRPDGRVFPVDQTAKDVVAILRNALDEKGVDLRLNTPVTSVNTDKYGLSGVTTGTQTLIPNRSDSRTDDRPLFGAKALLAEAQAISDVAYDKELSNAFIPCRNIIVSVGGSSYPNSGTTGDGWPWMRSLGHTVERIHAALAPIYLELDPFDPARSGVAIRDIVVKARLNGKELARWRNDLLFTHQGVSGPTVLGISRQVAENFSKGPISLEVDLNPDETHETLSAQMLEISQKHPKVLIETFLKEFLPDRLCPDLLSSSNIEPATPFGRLEKKARNRLIEHIKGWKLGTVRHVPLEKGEVVAGGVALAEVSPQTMESKIVPGLFLCGEILDIAGPVGGYNLQAAFSTGHVAGIQASLRATKVST